MNLNGELIVDLHLVKDDPADGGTEVALLRNGVQLYLFTSTGGTEMHRLYLSVKMIDDGWNEVKDQIPASKSGTCRGTDDDLSVLFSCGM